MTFDPAAFAQAEFNPEEFSKFDPAFFAGGISSGDSSSKASQIPGVAPLVKEKESSSSLGDKLLGAGEAALSTVTGIASFLPAIPSGLVNKVLKKASGIPSGTAEEEILAMQKAGTYEPRTEEGKRQTEIVGRALEDSKIPMTEMPGIGKLHSTIPHPVYSTIMSKLKSRDTPVTTPAEVHTVAKEVKVEHPEIPLEDIRNSVKSLKNIPEDRQINAQKIADNLFNSGASISKVNAAIKRDPLVGHLLTEKHDEVIAQRKAFNADEARSEPTPDTLESDLVTAREGLGATTPEALKIGQQSNKFSYDVSDTTKGYGRNIGFPQPRGTEGEKLFSNFADQKMSPAVREQFTEDMLKRASRPPQKYTEDAVKTHEEPFMGKYTLQVDAAAKGNTRAQILENGQVIAAARAENGMLDSIAVKGTHEKQKIGESLLRYLNDKGLANIHEVPDRSPGFVAIQRKALTPQPTEQTLGSGRMFNRPVESREGFIPPTEEVKPPTTEIKPSVVEPITPEENSIDSHKGLWDALHKVDNMKTNDEVVSLNLREQARKDGVSDVLAERFRNHSESIAAGEESILSPKDKELYDKYSGSLQEAINAKSKELGVDVDTTTAQFSNRIALNAKAWYQSLGNNPLGESVKTSGGFGRAPGSTKSRTVFSITGKGEDGVVTVKQVDGGWQVTQWKDGDPTVLGTSKSQPKVGETFKGMTIKEAKQSDIELHSPIRYMKDDISVKSKVLNSLNKAEREMAVVKHIKEQGLAKGFMASSNESYANPTFRPLSADAEKVFPQFRETILDPRYAEELEDFAKKYNHNPTVLDAVSNGIIRSMMLNPFPHVMNEFVHWFDARGASGFVTPTGLTGASQGLKGLALLRGENGAFRSVFTHNEFQQQLMKEGGYLLYPSTKTQVAFKRAMQMGIKDAIKEAKSDPTWGNIANALGMPLGRLFMKASDYSSQAMWATRDVMYTHLVKEQMAMGKTMKEAILEVGGHMPEYHIPTRVLGSRKVSQVMQNRALVFSGYHYGLLKALGENAKEISKLGRDNAAAAKGIDHALGMVLGMTLIFKGADKIVQAVLNDDTAEQRRAGVYHTLELAHDVSTGEKPYTNLLQSILTVNPAIMASYELLTGNDSYTGKRIFPEGTSVFSKEGAIRAARQVGSKFMPVQGVIKNMEGKETPKEFWARQMDVKLHPFDKEAKKEAAKHKAILKGMKEDAKLRDLYGVD